MSRTRRAVGMLAALAVITLGTLGVSGTKAPVRAANVEVARAPGVWRVTTMEHVDLWLHGFAFLTSDTGRVPFFLRGYKQQITAIKRQKNAFTLLDANQHDLSQGFARNPGLANAQFLAMYFQSFQQLVNAANEFVRSDGNPRASRDPQMMQEMGILSATFPSAADRDWLRLFVQSLQDENDKFYHAYWTGEQQARNASYQAFQEAWAQTYYPKLSRFLNNTQQPSGQVILSLPLGGEGRTINDSKADNLIAVEYPSTPADAQNAMFVFAHEAVAKLVDEAIADNTTPAQQRSGATSGYVGNGAVRGGALLLKRLAPDLVQAYMRFYVKTTGVEPQAANLESVFANAFPFPDPMLKALDTQIGVVLGGI